METQSRDVLYLNDLYDVLRSARPILRLDAIGLSALD